MKTSDCHEVAATEPSEYCVCGEMLFEHEDCGGACCDTGCECQRFRPAPMEK